VIDEGIGIYHVLPKADIYYNHLLIVFIHGIMASILEDNTFTNCSVQIEDLRKKPEREK